MQREDRARLLKFLESEEKKFTFEVECHISQRIKYIYNVIFPGWEKPKFYLRHIISRFVYVIDYSPIKCAIYKLIGVKIGKGVFISPQAIIDPHFPQLIEIKDYAIIGYGAKIFTHEFSDSTYTIGRVEIGEGVIVGGFAIIRAGVKIGKNVTVTLQKIVSKDIGEKKDG